MLPIKPTLAVCLVRRASRVRLVRIARIGSKYSVPLTRANLSNTHNPRYRKPFKWEEYLAECESTAVPRAALVAPSNNIVTAVAAALPAAAAAAKKKAEKVNRF
jgi:hypothetical protein